MPLPAHTTRLLTLAVAGLLAATPAVAHHPTGGQVPTTVVQGFLSGLGHPLIGLDHLAALLGVGLLAARFARGLALPFVWVAAMASGTGLHAAGLVGLVLIQAAVATGAALAARHVAAGGAMQPRLRLAGLGVAATGFGALALPLLG
jgi:urease accessory protein